MKIAHEEEGKRMSIKEERRTMKTEADMEVFFRELIPHLEKIEELLAKYEGQKTADIMVCNDGYVRAAVYKTGYELSKYKSDPSFKIRKEYSLEEIQEAVS